MASQFAGTFEKARKEWTERKHTLIQAYIRVALSKLATKRNPIVLIDGFAGANQYGEEREGSTLIMAIEANRITSTDVTVLACESNAEYFEILQKNLSGFVADGSVKLFPKTHSEALPELMMLSSSKSAVVFLDPDKPSSFSLTKDLKPWCERNGVTDILGLYFPGAVARMGAAGNQGRSIEIIRENVGGSTEIPQTEEEAISAFSQEVSHWKKFFGIYKMMKVNPKRVAYSIYGFSDHQDGLALLSDNVARDMEKWSEIVGSGNLFAEDPEFSKKASLRDELIIQAIPIVKNDEKIRSGKLAAQIFKTCSDPSRYFGQFIEKDFTKIRNEALKRLSETK